MFFTFVRVAVAVSLLSGPAAAQTRGKPARPAPLQALIACRQIADAAARLACFDRNVASVDAAETRGDLVVADRQQLRSARRSLFGLTLPRIALLDDDEDDAPKDFESKIRSVSATRDGKWTMQFEDAVWRTTETSDYQADPRAGDTVKITRGPLGSFKLSVQGRTAMRAVRVR